MITSELAGRAVEVFPRRKRVAVEATEQGRRRARDLLWLLRRKQGWSVAAIAGMAGVHRMTVYRRIRAMEATGDHRGREAFCSDPAAESIESLKLGLAQNQCE